MLRIFNTKNDCLMKKNAVLCSRLEVPNQVRQIVPRGTKIAPQKKNEKKEIKNLHI